MFTFICKWLYNSWFYKATFHQSKSAFQFYTLHVLTVSNSFVKKRTFRFVKVLHFGAV